MLSLSDPIMSAEDAVRYYVGYYAEENTGQWFGAGAKHLGLSGKVNGETFGHLLKGFLADGKTALVQNAGAEDRTCGWDFTLSAPKPVSVLWGILPEPERNKVEQIHRQAVERTLEIAEEKFGVVRRGKGGKIHAQADLTFALFDEYTSRANDMQLHTHCILINTGVTEDGKTGAIHGINFFRAKMLLGAVYQSELAVRLSHELNLNLTPENVGFGIEGIPQDFCRSQSKRRQAIEKALADRGLGSAEAAKIAALDTRPRKQVADLEKLFPVWQEAARAFGWGRVEALKLIHAPKQAIIKSESFAQELKSALAQISEADRNKKNILRAVKNTAIAHGVNGAQFLEAWQGIPIPREEPQKGNQKRQTHSREKSSSQAILEPSQKVRPSEKLASEQTSESKKHSRQTDARKGPNSIQEKAQQTKKSEGERNDRASGQEKKKSRVHQATDKNESGQQREKAGQTTEEKKANGKRQQSQTQKPQNIYQPSRAQRRRNLQFQREFGAAIDRIFPERQTRERLTRLAYRMAEIYDPDKKTLNESIAQLRPGAERAFIHPESPRPFPNSPLPSIKWLRVTKIALGDKPRKWGNIAWKIKVLGGEFRIQKSLLCPGAPKWSPLHGIEIPALRLTAKKPHSPQTKKSGTTHQAGRPQNQSKENGQSH